MYVPTNFAVALGMVIISTVCWGSWANTFKGTRGYRFELFYWDYMIGVLGTAILLALTLGSARADGTEFLANVHTADVSNMAFALLAGAIFNVANLLLVAGINLAGLAIAFPVAIGIALAEGVVMSYLEQPRGSALLLALAVTCALVAVILDGKAYAQLGKGATISRRAILICVVSGVLMGLFAPFVAHALNTGHALGSYSIGVFFAVGAFLCCFVANIYFMRRPLVGEPVSGRDYFRASPGNHALGLLGGAIWGLGMVFNFVAASLTGVAISYAIGQAAPMVAAAWGVLVWKEFEGAPAKAWGYLALMAAFYVLAITLTSFAYSAAT